MLRQVSLDLCDASEGYFDVPLVSSQFELPLSNIKKWNVIKF